MRGGIAARRAFRTAATSISSWKTAPLLSPINTVLARAVSSRNGSDDGDSGEQVRTELPADGLVSFIARSMTSGKPPTVRASSSGQSLVAIPTKDDVVTP